MTSVSDTTSPPCRLSPLTVICPTVTLATPSDFASTNSYCVHQTSVRGMIGCPFLLELAHSMNLLLLRISTPLLHRANISRILLHLVYEHRIVFSYIPILGYFHGYFLPALKFRLSLKSLKVLNINVFFLYLIAHSDCC